MKTVWHCSSTGKREEREIINTSNLEHEANKRLITRCFYSRGEPFLQSDILLFFFKPQYTILFLGKECSWKIATLTAMQLNGMQSLDEIY